MKNESNNYYFDNFMIFVRDMNSQGNKFKEIIFCILFIILNGVYYIIFYYLIYFSYLNYLFLEFAKIIYVMFKKANIIRFESDDKNEPVKIVYVIILAFQLFFSFVFNEVIEINICNLNYNTKDNISHRSYLETLNRKRMMMRNNNS